MIRVVDCNYLYVNNFILVEMFNRMNESINKKNMAAIHLKLKIFIWKHG